MGALHYPLQIKPVPWGTTVGLPLPQGRTSVPPVSPGVTPQLQEGALAFWACRSLRGTSAPQASRRQGVGDPEFLACHFWGRVYTLPLRTHPHTIPHHPACTP